MNNLFNLVRAYRAFLLELGEEFEFTRNNESYVGFSETFIDLIKSPEVGFTLSEVNTLIKMFHKFSMLETSDLPSHNAMKIMVNKPVDMSLLESAQTLSVTDFKELIKDRESGTQDRTYRYEIIKRTLETGNINKVYGDEVKEAIKTIQDGLQ